MVLRIVLRHGMTFFAKTSEVCLETKSEFEYLIND